MSRAKETIPAMLPQKKWLSKNEAMAYLDMSVNEFQKIIIGRNLSIASLTRGKKLWFKVAELDRLFENNLIKKPVGEMTGL